jgi:hypothetical protein
MSAPSPANQNRSGETPVNAREDESPPLPDEPPELLSDEVSPAAVDTPEPDVVAVVDAGVVVLVVVVDDPVGEVVVVVDVVVEVEVVVPEAAVNWTVTGRSGRFTPSVVSSAV